ncbi:uncharacterized protein LAESUDRAFT_718121 [Laetiporus sulphureus 93-53]|uniref:Uncharacterized protein n=1 Tax=Laetiporus sulphureus 93-53 TaxID=1314785 RepID=A0A165B7Y6_9APHY|nr:uncharacterized protein LAESUDRAFT_718121 [Laetiporus sulphureus 93-53]KZT00450.1 hypothetical protein LAESUDRAFT_718121 [Laetiporus sulphureus 93-53]
MADALHFYPRTDAPDEDLQPLYLDLLEFNAIAKRLLQSGREDAIYDFVHFVLAGRVKRDGEECRVFLNPRLSALIPELAEMGEVAMEDTCQLTRDYDSVIGISRTLPYDRPLAVYPLPPFKDALTSDNHMKYSITRHDMTHKVLLNRIPNMAFAKVDIRAKCNIFFPALYVEDRSTSPTLTQAQLTHFYEDILRPVIEEIDLTAISHWPVNYKAAFTLSQDVQGQLHFSSTDVPVHLLDNLRDNLLRRLDEDRNFTSTFFLHKLRGTKGAFSHNLYDDTDCQLSLDQTLDYLRAEQTNSSQWWIDVVLEIQQKNHVVTWLSAAHEELTQFALPSTPHDAIRKLMKSDYHIVDRVAQLDDCAGARIYTGSRGKQDGVHYIQFYTTEKNAHYQHHRACAGREEEDPQEGCARFEVRVSLRNALTALRDISSDLVSTSCISIPASVWWSFKAWCMAALKYVFEGFQNDLGAARIWRPSLTLGVVAIYMSNALRFRPSSNHVQVPMVVAACFHTPSEDRPQPTSDDESSSEDGQPRTPIMYDQGIYFLADIVEDNGIYRLRNKRSPDALQLAHAYRTPTFVDLQILFTGQSV